MIMNVQMKKRFSAFVASGVALLGLAMLGQDLDPDFVQMIADRVVALTAAYIGGQSLSDVAKEWRNGKA